MQFLTNHREVGLPLAKLAAGLAAALMLWTSFAARSVDFYYILAAGRTWLTGADPYGSAFTAAGAGVLPAGAIGFVYPPNWWIIAVALAAIPVSAAVVAWKLLNLAAIAAAGILLSKSAGRLEPGGPRWLHYVFLACLFSCGATANALRLGQTSIIIFLGFALLVEGMTFNRVTTQAIGLSLLLLKPQIGLLFLLLAVTRPPTRSAAIAASVVTAGACLPLLLTLGFTGTIDSAINFVGNVGSYDKLPWNWPTYMSGAPFIFSQFGVRVSPVMAIAAAFLIGEAALRVRGEGCDPSRWITDFWLVSVGVLAAAIPLHLYDFVLCIPCLLLLPTFRDRASAGLVVLCALLVWSANDVARALFLLSGGTEHAYWEATRLEAALLTLGGLAILAAAFRNRLAAVRPLRFQPFLARKEEASAAAE